MRGTAKDLTLASSATQMVTNGWQTDVLNDSGVGKQPEIQLLLHFCPGLW